jgi:hypothetical protein
MKKALAIVGVVAALALGYAAYSEYAPRSTPQGQPPLVRLNSENIPELQKAFNESSDRVRVLAMLSPT